MSELFPIEIRGMTLALFDAIATLAVAPTLFGALVQSGSREALFAGYAGASMLMLVAALAAHRLGVDAEGRSPEEQSAR